MATGLDSRDASITAPRRAPRPAMLVAPYLVAPAVLAVVVLALVGLPLVVAVAVPVVVALGVGWWVLRSAEAAVTAGLALHPATEADQPRLFNMVDGLCDSHGFRRPALLVIDDDARNAVVFGRRADAPSLAVTRGWLTSLSRMGLEGCLARELARANAPTLPAATTVVSLGRLLPAGARRRLVRRVCGPHQAVLDDFDAVRYTRYPPGLADALATLAEGTPVVGGAAMRSAHLWVAPPAVGETDLGETASLDLRVDALREL